MITEVSTASLSTSTTLQHHFQRSLQLLQVLFRDLDGSLTGHPEGGWVLPDSALLPPTHCSLSVPEFSGNSQVGGASCTSNVYFLRLAWNQAQPRVWKHQAWKQRTSTHAFTNKTICFIKLLLFVCFIKLFLFFKWVYQFLSGDLDWSVSKCNQ